MKKNEKILIATLLIVLVLVIGVISYLKNKGKNKELPNANETETQDTMQETANSEIEMIGKYDAKIEEGTILEETQKNENLEVSNVKIAGIVGDTSIVADVKNIGEETTKETTITLILLGKDKKEVARLDNLIIGTIEAGETSKIDLTTSIDCTGATSFIIE